MGQTTTGFIFFAFETDKVKFYCVSVEEPMFILNSEKSVKNLSSEMLHVLGTGWRL